MQRALVEVGRKMNDLDNRMTQIKAKEKYQLRQIRETEDKQRQGGGEKQRLSLSQKQLQSIKEVLQANSQDLADVVKQLNGAKKDLCAWQHFFSKWQIQTTNPDDGLAVPRKGQPCIAAFIYDRRHRYIFFLKSTSVVVLKNVWLSNLKGKPPRVDLALIFLNEHKIPGFFWQH